jgi:hypothetical protein
MFRSMDEVSLSDELPAKVEAPAWRPAGGAILPGLEDKPRWCPVRRADGCDARYPPDVPELIALASVAC